MIGVLPNAYDLLYRWSQEPQLDPNVKNITALIMKARMLNILREHQPDLLVFTHPFPCCAAAYLRRKKQLTVPLAAVMTDFASHQMWVHDEIDTYFVANNEIKTNLCSKGLAANRIFVTGIPISSKFANASRNVSREKPGPPTVLIMGGGLGLGAVEQAVSSLKAAKTQFKIVVVAGGNDRLKQKLLTIKSSSRHPITVIGYTQQVHELMANASLLITKPGALTCSEALAMELPMLVLSPIPGQEEDNADYLTRQGVALRIPPARTLAGTVDELLAKPAALSAMRAKACALSRPAAARDIATLLTAGIPNRTAIFPAS